jgi:hypothetical protein
MSFGLSSAQLTKECMGIAMQAQLRPVEVTLDQILSAMGVSDSLGALERLQRTKEFVEFCSLTLDPGFDKGDFNTSRVLRATAAQALTVDGVCKEIAQGEGGKLEFKSSLLFNYKTAASNADALSNSSVIETVSGAALRAIAGLLNARGVVVYIGVADNQDHLGIECDYRFLGSGSENVDKWELRLRDLVKSRFNNGDQVLAYVRCTFVVTRPEITIARIEVTERKRLSFLKYGGQYKLFCRQGNQTNEVPIEGIEEFLEQRQSGVDVG